MKAQEYTNLEEFMMDTQAKLEEASPTQQTFQWEEISRDEGCICKCGYDHFYFIKHTNGQTHYIMECVKCHTKYPVM